MGSCQSAADGSSPLSVNQAGVEDIKRNITNKFQDHKNESTKKIYSAQKLRNLTVLRINKTIVRNTKIYLIYYDYRQHVEINQ